MLENHKNDTIFQTRLPLSSKHRMSSSKCLDRNLSSLPNFLQFIPNVDSIGLMWSKGSEDTMTHKEEIC